MRPRSTTFRVLILASFAVAGAASAHATLLEAQPRAGETLAAAPERIRLRFNETLEPAFSKIVLRDGHGAAIRSGVATVETAHPDTLLLVPPSLPSGKYKLDWSTMTRDGHRTKGSVPFQVR